MRQELKLISKDTDRQREALSAQKLEAERNQRKLLEAHYNDAIPIETLRTEQKRLGLEPTAVNRDLESLSVDLDKNEKHLAMAVELAQHAANAHRHAPEQIRRMLNQIFFERLEVRMNEHDEHHFDAVFPPRSRIST